MGTSAFHAYLRPDLRKSNSPSRLHVLLIIRLLRLRPVQHLQKRIHPSSHAGMHVRFRRFDMVVEVVTEKLDAGNGIFLHIGGEVAGEEDCQIDASHRLFTAYFITVK